MDLTVRRAEAADAAVIAPLFDAYRIFYKQSPDLNGALHFISERLQKNESIIFIAFLDEKLAGFTQLYPLFTSVGMKKAWLLNDLFVEPFARGNGIAAVLLDAAKDFGKTTNSKWLMLQTQADNYIAQSVYEKNGWTRENDYFYRFDIS